jgi:hypothetical protein
VTHWFVIVKREKKISFLFWVNYLLIVNRIFTYLSRFINFCILMVWFLSILFIKQSIKYDKKVFLASFFLSFILFIGFFDQYDPYCFLAYPKSFSFVCRHHFLG